MGEALPLGDPRWLRTTGGRVVHDDTNEHAALVAQTLGVDEATWGQALDRYADEMAGRRDDVRERLAALTRAWAEVSPHAGVLAPAACPPCPACRGLDVEPRFVRQATGTASLTYACCSRCGHATLVQGGASSSIYERAAYYQTRDLGGAGYRSYEADRAYRETKGRRLLDWVAARAERRIDSMLEVGSGFGFTQRAAVERGWRTQGVDLSPIAAEKSEGLYSLPTVEGTLRQALRSGAIGAGAWDLVLYQFVLEHVRDVVEELELAAEALAPRGVIALALPSIDAVEVVVFAGSYRSFRRDHLHLFSRDSLGRLLDRAGLRLVAFTTECSIHTLRGFLPPAELERIYAAGGGPDMTVLAEKA